MWNWRKVIIVSIKGAEIVGYVDGISQKLQSLNPYLPDPSTVFSFLRFMVKQAKSSSKQVDISESTDINQSISMNRFYLIP